MLLRQNFRRRHHHRNIAVSRCRPNTSRRHQRFTAAHVALHQTIHHAAGFHIRQRRANRPVLRSGRSKGQPAVKTLRIHRLKSNAALRRLLSMEQFQCACQIEQFLKNQPLSGNLQREKVLREMHISVGELRLTQFMPLRNLPRQSIGKGFPAAAQAGFHGRQHGFLIQSRRCAINRNNPSGQLTGILFFMHRIGHGFLMPRHADFSVKQVGLPHLKLMLCVGLIEIGNLHGSRFVRSAEPHKLHSPPNPAQHRLCGHHCLQAAGFLRLRLPNGANHRPVLVAPGKIVHQIAVSKNAQLMKGSRLFFSHTR